MAKWLLNSYLNVRRQYVSINYIKPSNKIIKYEISQGSVSGPLLFLININNLPSFLLTATQVFADDAALLILN